MTAPWDILVVSSDLESRKELVQVLSRQGIDPISAATLRECLPLLASGSVGLAFCSSHLADGDYRDVLKASRSLPWKPKIVVTSHTEWDEYLEAVRLGAFDVIPCPCRPTDVEWMVIRARRERRIDGERSVPPNVARTSEPKAVAAPGS